MRDSRPIKNLLMTVLVVGFFGGLAALGTLASFVSTTSNPANDFAAGTVYISDNDAGSALYSVANRKPGDSVTECIKVTYTGTLEAALKLYGSSVNAVGTYVDLTITPGTQGAPSFPDCSGFVPDAGGAVYTGTLKGFADSHTGYGNGLAVAGPSAANWSENDAFVYRFQLTLQDDNNANGGSGGPLSTGLHSFTWEAHQA